MLVTVTQAYSSVVSKLAVAEDWVGVVVVDEVVTLEEVGDVVVDEELVGASTITLPIIPS